MRTCIVALAVLLACACGQRVEESITATAPSSAAASATRTAVPVLSLCRPEQVAGVFETWGAAAGSNVGEFRLEPVAGAICGLPANPVHRFITKYGARVLTEATPPAPIVAALVPLVQPSGKNSTFLTLTWSNHGAEPGWSCRDRTPMAGIEIQLDSEWASFLFERDPVGICVDPIEHVFAQITAPGR